MTVAVPFKNKLLLGQLLTTELYTMGERLSFFGAKVPLQAGHQYHEPT